MEQQPRYHQHELLSRSMMALSNDILIKISITFYCPLLAFMEAQKQGFYNESRKYESAYDIKNGKPGANSVVYLTLMKKYYPKTFWNLSRVVKINKTINRGEQDHDGTEQTPSWSKGHNIRRSSTRNIHAFRRGIWSWGT